MSKKALLLECRPRTPFQVVESLEVEVSPGRKSYRMRGVFQNFEDVNLNNRKYPRSIWDNQLAEGSDFARRMTSRLALGHIEHPEDGITRLPEVAMAVVEAHIATDDEIRESNGAFKAGDIVGTLELLPTPRGEVLKALTEANIPWGVSSRGNGSIKESGECDIVDDDFVLETWDAVFSPSVARAIPSLVTESKDTVQKKVALLESTWSPEDAVPAPKAPAPPAPKPTVHTVVTPSPQRTESSPKSTPTPPPHMSKLSEIRKLKLQLSELAQRSRKGLKASDKGAIFETLDEIRVKAASLVQEDATVGPIAAKIYTDADAFAKLLDEEDDFPPAGGPPAPAGPPAADAPPAPDAPPADEPAGEEAEVVAALQTASDKLRELAPEGDTEAEAAAAELDALADRVSGVDVNDAPEDIDVSKLPFESRRVIAMYQRRHKVMEAQLGRMSTAASALLEKHKKLAEAGTKLDGHSIKEWRDAAQEVTGEYHTECLALGRALFQLKHAALFEANKTELLGFKNFKKFTAFVEALKKKAAAPKTESTNPSTPVAPVTESNQPAPQPTPSTPKTEPLAETAHSAVLQLKAARKH